MPDGGPVVLINAFELPPEESNKRFLAAWRPSRDFMAERAGFLDTVLHRSLEPDAEFRFVNLAGWRNPDSFRFAIEDPGFREASVRIPGRSHPGLYQVVHR